MMRPLTIGSLFAGVGGFDLGFERAGFQTRWCVEWDKHAQNILRRHFPHAAIHGDITAVEPEMLEPVDVITFGAPCQDLSVAGKRKGIVDGERSSLFFTAVRLIRDLKPTVAIYENVPGLLSSCRGRDFGLVLDALAEVGYDVAWITLDSQYFGVPQRRQRVFTIAAREACPGLATRCVEQILSVGARLCGNTPQGDEARQGVAADAPAGVGGAGGSIGLSTFETPKFGYDLSPTVCVPSATGGGQPPAVAYRDCAAWAGVAVAFGWNKPAGHSMMVSDITTNPLQSGPCSQPAVAYCPDTVNPLAVRGRGSNRECETRTDGTANALPYSNGGRDGTGIGAVAHRSIVRRLTPVECERLQGFPDDWTAWGLTADGQRVELSDTQRYRQMGNAVTVNVAEHIALAVRAALKGAAQ